MKVLQLRMILQSSSTTEIAALDEALAIVDDLSLSKFVAAISPALAKEAKKLRAEQEKGAAIEAAISRYVGELNTEKDDSATFETIVKRIEKDRSVKIGEAREIASRFLKEPSKHKTKKDALKAILQRQIADRRSRVRSSQVSGLF